MADLNIESSENISSEEEPKLKYVRMGNDVNDILSIDAVSCIIVHPKFVCLGSQWGIIYLLDHEGNTATIENGSKRKEFHAHTIAVNHISVDSNGEHIATCSDDGKIVIHGLYSAENNHNMALGRTIKSVAIDPLYKSNSGFRFIIGDNKLTLYERSFFNRIKTTVLCECEGYVQAIAWQDRFVAWTGDVGVRVYDITARCSLGLIKWETSSSVPIDEYRCNLLWSSDKVLMIGWVDTVRICFIRKRRTIELQSKATPEYLVDPMYSFPTDYFICGLAPFEDLLAILGYPKENGAGQRPILSIVDYKQSELVEISSDSLNMRGYENYSCNNYHLAWVAEETRYYIVSPKDIITATQYDIDDRITWLIEHGNFQKSLDILEKAGGKSLKYTLSSIRINQIDKLIAAQNYEQAALMFSNVCATNKGLWASEIYKFANISCLRYICQYIPTSIDDKIPHHIYELILFEYMKFDPHGFLKLVKDWNPALYEVNVIIDAVAGQLLLKDVDKTIYLESLAILHCHKKKYDKALSLYLKLQHKDVFILIKKYNLYNYIHDKILTLMRLDTEKAIAMLLDKANVPVEIVEEQLRATDVLLYKYLDALSKVDSTGKFHGTLVRLYAKFDRTKLLPFLKSSDNYPIQEALDVCKENQYYAETVYLLGRMGSVKDALNIILMKLQDINQAVLFCQDHDDKELWMDLINHSLDKPEYIAILLKRIGNYVDPRILIRGIKPGCEIYDLKDSLGKMMRDFNLQLSVQEACKAITLRNYFDLHEKLIKSHYRGVCITDEYVCSACHGKIIIKDLSHSTDMIVYNCRHTFHMECLPEMLRYLSVCALCNPVKID